ncbi:MAG: hypothetical protein MK160_05380 [Rhodobacteraceae bacterium]|nr:hypothetical protein [Paracoccaceae bacterium]
MIDASEIDRKVALLETLLGQKFGASRGSLTARVRKAGRRLPRWVRRDVLRVAEAQSALQGPPKLAVRVDLPRVDRAFRNAERWLKAVDAADRRRGAILGMLGALVFNILVLGVLLVIVLIWRGFV